MELEYEHTKLRLIEAQMQVLHYQHRDVTEKIRQLEASISQSDLSTDNKFSIEKPNGSVR